MENPQRSNGVLSPKIHKMKVWVLAAGLAILLLILGAAWVIRAMTDPFETISRGELMASGIEIRSPEVLVIARQSDIPKTGWEGIFPPEINQQLMAVDYRRSIAILVLREYGVCCVDGVDIQWVGHQWNQVILLADFKTQDPKRRLLPAVYSPYNLFLIPRYNLEGEVRFSLRDGLREVAVTTRQLP